MRKGPQEAYTDPQLWWEHPMQYSRQLDKKRKIKEIILEFFQYLAGKGVEGPRDVVIQ